VGIGWIKNTVTTSSLFDRIIINAPAQQARETTAYITTRLGLCMPML